MKVVELICAPVRTGFYFDDHKAIKAGAKPDGFNYRGTPQTKGFSHIEIIHQSF